MKENQPRLLTCRYWALGPACPNIDEHGVNACEYAHWDTGTLADFYRQRGTCAWWLSGTCRNGQGCFYEHRHTGLPGLYQGVIQLYGTNLEIADAANRAGFNTFNHEALMNLIWSVKRVMRRPGHGKNNAVTILKDPIYPDRYRPSGVGDNTKRKRHTAPTGSPPPFHPVKQLNRKRRRNKAEFSKNTGKDIDYITLNRVQSGRISKMGQQDLPTRLKQEKAQSCSINLLSDHNDDHITAANISAKRQKIDTGHVDRHRREDSRTNVHPPDTLLDAVPVDRDRNNTTLELTTVLKSVRGILQQAKKSMVDCQLTMKSLFQRNSVRLGEDSIFSLMTGLSKEIYRAHDGARDGIIEVEKSVQWLECEDKD